MPPLMNTTHDLYRKAFIKYRQQSKVGLYEAITRPALTHGSECWAMKVTNKRKIATTEIRMPRGILGVSRPHSKRGNPTHPTHFTDRRGYARWPSSLVWTCPKTRYKQRHRRVLNLTIPGARRRGRPKKTWHQQLKDDMTGVGVT